MLEAGELVAKLPDAEHPSIAVLLDQERVLRKAAIAILDNLQTLTPERQVKI